MSLVRLVLTPSSPPKKPRRISELEATSSPSPSEIMANAVPARRVETDPKMMPNARPLNAPTIGMRNSGTGSRSWITVFMAWTAKNPPRP